MLFTILQAYNTAFSFLDKIYDDIQNEDLGSMLSDLNPNLFTNSNSAHPSSYDDWMESVLTVTSKDELTFQETYDVMLRFMKKYENLCSLSFVKVYKKINVNIWNDYIDEMKTRNQNTN